MTTHKDPVCGMQIDEEDAAGQSDTNGQISIFVRYTAKISLMLIHRIS